MKRDLVRRWLVVGFLLLSGCSGTSEGDETSDSPPGGDGDGDGAGIECSAESAMRDTCLESTCPITFDAIVFCGQPVVKTSSHVQGGLRVGPDVAGEGVHFFAAGWFPSVGLFGTVSAEYDIDLLKYGDHLNDQPYFIMNAAGEPLIALSGRSSTEWELSVLSPTRTPEPETILAGDEELSAFGAAVDPTDQVHVWSRAGLELNHYWGVLGESFAESAAFFSLADEPIFGIDATGEEMAFAVVENPEPTWDIVRRTAAGDEVVSSLPYSPFGFTGRVVPRATSGASGDYLAGFDLWTAAEGFSPIHLIHAVRQGVTTSFDIAMPESVFEETCMGGDEQCQAECLEVGEGHMGPGVEMVESADGRIWAAWIWGHTDRTVPYEYRCADDIGCDCRPKLASRDDGYGELVVARVDLDLEQVDEVLRLPLGKVAGSVADYEEHRQGFHMSAFGSDLAVGINTYENPIGMGDEGRLRLLRIDTSLIP